MKILYKPEKEIYGEFSSVEIDTVEEMKSCPIKGLGLLINNKIYQSVGISSENIKDLIIESKTLVHYNEPLTTTLLIEFIQANTRHFLGGKYKKQNTNFWYPDEIKKKSKNNNRWYLRNENFRLVIVGEDKWTKKVDLFDYWTIVKINAFSEFYTFWKLKGVNICKPFEIQPNALNYESNLFENLVKVQKELFGYEFR